MPALLTDRPQVGPVACRVVGSGLPVTVFAHGLGGSSAETRALAVRVPGTRVLLDFRGHGDSAALLDGWDYDLLADDLLAVADAFAATQAVGLSVGAGALLRALSRQPARFDRIAVVLPAAIDESREDGAVHAIRRLGNAIDDGDVEKVRALLLAELPPAVRAQRVVQLLLARRAAALVLRPAPRPRFADRPLTERSVLRTVRAPALVVGQRDDPLHPLDLARELAGELPRAELLELAPGGVFWTAHGTVTRALADHLDPEDA